MDAVAHCIWKREMRREEKRKKKKKRWDFHCLTGKKEGKQERK